jgi:hypothetical protein
MEEVNYVLKSVEFPVEAEYSMIANAKEVEKRTQAAVYW